MLPRDKRVRWGWSASAVIHLAVLGLLAVESVSPWIPRAGGDGAGPIGGEGSSSSALRLVGELAGGAANTCRVEEPAIDGKSFASASVASADPSGGLRRLVHSRIRQASGRPSRETIRDLDRMTRRLETFVSPESLGEITRRLQSEFGPSAALQVVARDADRAEFDAESAHIQDAYRDTTTQTYIAVLVDRAGQRLDVPLDDVQGERLAGLMRWMKSHPLVDGIYRNIVMGILDRMGGVARAPSP